MTEEAIALEARRLSTTATDLAVQVGLFANQLHELLRRAQAVIPEEQSDSEWEWTWSELGLSHLTDLTQRMVAALRWGEDL